MFNLKFGKNLKIALKKRGISSKELASIVGVKPNTISNYITGVSSPSFEILKKILHVLELTSDDLVYGDFESDHTPLSSAGKSVRKLAKPEYTGRVLNEIEVVKAYNELYEDLVSLKDRIIEQQSNILDFLMIREVGKR